MRNARQPQSAETKETDGGWFDSGADARVIFAIGDVHGEVARLKQLHKLIRERRDLFYQDRPLQIVHLGDYVDRGSDSAGVIEHLIGLENDVDIRAICLRGNHEAMMLDGLCHATPTAYESWLDNGGEQTMASYRLRGSLPVPLEHIAWLKTLPNLHVEHDQKLIFVHAGIDPRDYPNESEDIYLWTRSKRFFDVPTWENDALEGWTVVHGHTPTGDFFPEDQAGSGRRINIDTGAVFGGRLTAAMFAPGEQVQFIYA